MTYDLPYKYANTISNLLLSNSAASYSSYDATTMLYYLISKYSDAPVQLFRLPDGILGHTYKDECGTTVFISSKITNTGRKWFTVAHELGHLLMHIDNPVRPLTDDSSIDYPETIEEKEANWFAAHVLLPDSVIIKAIIDGFSVGRIMKTSKVSKEMIRYRILDIFKNVYYIPTTDNSIIEELIDNYFINSIATPAIHGLIPSLTKLPRKDIMFQRNSQTDYWLQFQKTNLEVWKSFLEDRNNKLFTPSQKLN